MSAHDLVCPISTFHFTGFWHMLMVSIAINIIYVVFPMLGISLPTEYIHLVCVAVPASCATFLTSTHLS